MTVVRIRGLFSSKLTSWLSALPVLSKWCGTSSYSFRYIILRPLPTFEGVHHRRSNSSFHPPCLQKHLPRLLKQGVTAIVCSHDLLAHTVMLHLQELHIQVPEDISIIGFDDLPICAYTMPPMTTIRQDRTQIGKSAYYALSSLMQGTPISTLLLHAQLIVRQSTGPAPEVPYGLREKK